MNFIIINNQKQNNQSTCKMDSDTMTLYVNDSLQEIIMVEVSRTLIDVKKKLMEKGARPD